jgi:hypothetical protein
MAGATEVGINFEEYGHRVIDVKADIEEAIKGVSQLDLKEQIAASLAAYVDAGQAWNQLIRRGGTKYSDPFLSPDRDPWVDALPKKYDIPTETIDPKEGMSAELLRTLRPGDMPAYRIMRQHDVLSAIWAAARKHLEKAEALAQ